MGRLSPSLELTRCNLWVGTQFLLLATLLVECQLGNTLSDRSSDDSSNNPADNSRESLRNPPKGQSEISKRDTKFTNGPFSFLDEMLANYDKRVWPTYGEGKPTHVHVFIHVNSLGSINAANMDYSMDIYLRQLWIDPRLRYEKFGINDTVTLNGHNVKEIWVPDLFFRNVKGANFHFVTVPNRLMKLRPEGSVLYSMRLTLRLSCHMFFHHYPLDTQKCWIVLGTYAQTTDQVIISWLNSQAITIEEGMELPEFDMYPPTVGTFIRSVETGNFSFLNVSFIFTRQNGYHLVQTYLPTFLIVMISWVSFWLHVDATPARVTLGVTTLLTLTTVASGVRTQLPPVSYVKAIDIWIGACSVMVFGALLEFTLVNYLSRRKIKPKPVVKTISKSRQILEICSGDCVEGKGDPENYESNKDLKTNLRQATAVDRMSRILFPALFTVFNLVYWSYYLLVSYRSIS